MENNTQKVIVSKELAEILEETYANLVTMNQETFCFLNFCFEVVEVIKANYIEPFKFYKEQNLCSDTLVDIFNYGFEVKKPWRASHHGRYWIINGDVMRVKDTNCRLDKEHYEVGNYFETKEQAEYAYSEIKEVFKRVQREIREGKEF